MATFPVQKRDADLEVERQIQQAVWRRRFGYMRLSGSNPYVATYREKLLESGVTEIFEDIPADPLKRPKLDVLLAKAQPGDTFVIYRLNHLSDFLGPALGDLSRICGAGLEIEVIDRRYADRPRTNAALSDLIGWVNAHISEEQRKGGDGGSGNGGP
jgi:Resolvase, N terminal domain